MSDFLILHTFGLAEYIIVSLTGFFAYFIGNAVGSDGFVYLFGIGNISSLDSQKVIGSMKLSTFMIMCYTVYQYKKNKSTTLGKIYTKSFPYGAPLWVSSSILGAILAQYINQKIMSGFVFFAALSIIIFKIICPEEKDFIKNRGFLNNFYYYVILSIISFYIGLFGPGGSTFVIVLGALTIGMRFAEGSIVSRNITIAGNIPSIIIFAFCNNIYLDLAFFTAICGIPGVQLSMIFVKKYSSRFLNLMLMAVLYGVVVSYGLKLFA